MLGQHDATRATSDQLQALLNHRELLTADAAITRQAQRCSIAAGIPFAYSLTSVMLT